MKYEESIGAPLLFYLMVGIVLLISGYSAVFIKGPWWLLYLNVLIFGILLCALMLFRELRIKLDDARISFGFPFLTKTILFEHIEKCEPLEFDWRRIFSYGIRADFANTTAFLGRSSKGIEITMFDGKRYIIATKNPERICSIISKKVSARNVF
jgi:hypothetical protein